MLGIGADRFMLNQMTERVIAHPSNAAGRSMQVPDRERAGSAHVMMKVGQMPGPQRQVSSSYVPGMGPAPDLAKPPAMAVTNSALPGMGMFGDITISNMTIVTVIAGAAAAWYFMGRKKG